MKKILISAFVALAFAGICVPAGAQDELQDSGWNHSEREYQYPRSFEIPLGATFNLYSINGADGKALGMAGGADYQFRYTWYFAGHWGAYAQLGSNTVTADTAELFGIVNKADGGAYRYAPGWYYYSTYNVSVYLGAAYRYDFGAWSLVGRAALGYGQFDQPSYEYKRVSRDAAATPLYIIVEPADLADQYEYLLDDSYYSAECTPALMFTGSAQICYTTGRRIYFFAEAGFELSPSRYTYAYTTIGYKSAYNPSNWVEAVAYSGTEDAWTIDKSTSATTTKKAFVTPDFYLNWGIGIRLGNYKTRNR